MIPLYRQVSILLRRRRHDIDAINVVEDLHERSPAQSSGDDAGGAEVDHEKDKVAFVPQA